MKPFFALVVLGFVGLVTVWAAHAFLERIRTERQNAIQAEFAEHGKVRTFELDPNDGRIVIYFDDGEFFKKISRWELFEYMCPHGMYRRIYPLNDYSSKEL